MYCAGKCKCFTTKNPSPEIRKHFRDMYGPMIIERDYHEFIKAMARKWTK